MSTHQVTLVFEDGRVVKFDASEDDSQEGEEGEEVQEEEEEETEL